MTKGFFDYEGRDDDEPRTYYDSRVAKAKRDGTWTKPPPLPPSDRPKGAATATAAQSFWMAVTWTALSVPRLGLYLSLVVTDPGSVDWFNMIAAVLFCGFAVYYWRSWRLLLAHEADHGRPAGQERADRRTKIIAVVALGFVTVASVVLLLVD